MDKFINSFILFSSIHHKPNNPRYEISTVDASLRTAILSEQNTAFMQTPFSLIIVPLRGIVALLRGLGWRQKHAPPLRKMNKCYRNGAPHRHHSHEGQPVGGGEPRGGEEQQLRQPPAEVSPGSGKTGDEAQRSSGNEGDDAVGGAACGLGAQREEDHGKNCHG